MLFGKEFCALSHGHGPKGWLLQEKGKRYQFRIRFLGFYLVRNGYMFQVRESRKSKSSWKWVLSIPKDAARLGDLGKRVFWPKFQKNGDGHLEFSFLVFPGFLEFPDFLVCSLRLGPLLKKFNRVSLEVPKEPY